MRRLSLMCSVAVLSVVSFDGVRAAWLTLPTMKIPTAGEILEGPRQTLEDLANGLREAGEDFGNNVREGVADTANHAREGLEKKSNEAREGFAGFVENLRKHVDGAAGDTGEALVAAYKFVERVNQDLGASAEKAHERAAEGKYIDAIWHMATDRLVSAEKNAALAVEESNVIESFAQIGASAYGGPGGAAAYASWRVYSQTKDVNLALKVGIITGAMSYVTGKVSKMPDGTNEQLAQKVMLAGAVGGIGVAVSGGDEAAVKDGFIKSGGMVFLRAKYEDYIGAEPDLKGSEGPGYCMATESPNAPCAPLREAYAGFDADGKPLKGDNGSPLVDVRKTDLSQPHVGRWSDENGGLANEVVGETGAVMVTISRLPATNAMSVGHDHWVVEMKMDPVTKVLSIVPAAVATYHMTENPVQDSVEKQVLESKETN